MFRIILLAVLLGSANMSQAELQTEEVSYSGGGVEMKGLLVWDDSIEGERPGILVVHEWWGQNKYPRKRAKMLAELGYTALAIDMYGDKSVADHPEQAGAFMTAVIENMEAGRARFEAALELLKSHASVNADKTGAIGYCFGGGVVLHMARVGSDARALRAPLLVLRDAAPPGRLVAATRACRCAVGAGFG